MKNSPFLTGHRLAVQRKTNKGRPLEQISSAAFSSLLSLALQTSERALTDIANERAQESDFADRVQDGACHSVVKAWGKQTRPIQLTTGALL